MQLFRGLRFVDWLSLSIQKEKRAGGHLVWSGCCGFTAFNNGSISPTRQPRRLYTIRCRCGGARRLGRSSIPGPGRGYQRESTKGPRPHQPALPAPWRGERGRAGKEPEKVLGALTRRACDRHHQTEIWLHQGALSWPGKERQPSVCNLRANKSLYSTTQIHNSLG